MSQRSSASGAEMRATRLAPAFDLLAACGAAGGGGFPFLFERDGRGVAAAPARTDTMSWFALRDDPAGAADIVGRLRALGRANEVPAVAVGAFPFDDRPGFLAVPSQLVVRTDSASSWLLEIVDADAVPGRFRPIRRVAGSPSDPFDPDSAVPEPSEQGYARAVATSVERIRRGSMDKVVLARTMHVHPGRTLDPVRLAHRLRAVDPHAYTFITPVGPSVPGPDGRSSLLVGASPELLVSRHGRAVRSTPLAGSAPRAGDPEEDRANAEALFASSKNRQEHAIVVDAIAETLGPRCDGLAWDPEPVLFETANVWHLATRFEGTLRDPAPNVVELVAALHPTPAVCGTPDDVAAATIAELEPFDRGGYAGPVGWVDAEGDGEWAIALRCAELEGDRATLFAGAGIVRDSDPLGEVDETDRKFRAFLDSLRWG